MIGPDAVVRPGVTCGACGEPAQAGDRWCESCGSPLDGADPAPEGTGAGDRADPPTGRNGPAAAGPAGAGSPGVPPAGAPADGAEPAGAEPTGAEPPVGAEPDDRPGGGAGWDARDPAVTCPACGGVIATDGYCGTCGAPAPSERDHWVERPAPWVAGVCDRGLRHAHNEDALAAGADPEPGGTAALVVCDGVSSAPGSDVAALAAANAARDVLRSPGGGVETFLTAGPDRTTAPDAGGLPGPGAGSGGAGMPGAAGPGGGDAPVVDTGGRPDRPAGVPVEADHVPVEADHVPAGAGGVPAGADDLPAGAGAWVAIVERAVAAAHEAATAVAGLGPPGPAGDRPVNPPSCTLAAAVVDGPLVVTGCVGDSRVYWLADGGHAVLLTTDDSWAAEQIAGGVPREQAENGPHAHAITRWLGRDSPDPTPSITVTTVAGPGWVLVCSDGLWNYCSEPADMAGLVAAAEQQVGRDPVGLAAALVVWANGQGGHDNISVALARLEPATTNPS